MSGNGEKPRMLVKLKLNTNLVAAATAAAVAGKSSSSSTTKASATATQTPSVPTPSTIILKTKALPPATPTTAATATPKIIRLKTSASFKVSAPSTPKTPTIKLTSHASKPAHTRVPGHRSLPLGLGYDSEASDREDDPAIEEQFILRMVPGEDCDFLREAIEGKEMNRETDVWMKFKDDRRAVVSVRGRLYAAALVDLPCVIESSKTVDKKNIYKTADICQMLIVGDRIVHEDQVFSIPLIENNSYPHGITPPLHYVRKRRFRKRISNRTIEHVEEVVEALLAADAAAHKSRYELTDPTVSSDDEDQNNRANNMGAYGEEDAEGEDAEGDDDEMYEEGEEEDEEDMEDAEGEDDIDDDAFANEFANEFEKEFEGTGMDIDTPANTTINPQSTPMNNRAGSPSSGSEEEDDDDDAAAGNDEEMDEDAQEAAQNIQKLREEIVDLESMIKAKMREYESVGNPIMKQRIRTVLDGLKAELELKKVEINSGAISDED